MRSLALGGASAIATILSLGVEAADFAYPPSAIGSYPPVSAPAPQVLVIPGAPAPIPQYSGAPTAPPIGRPPVYSEVPPITPPDVVPGAVRPPRAACDPVWRCGNGGCGWRPSCAPKPEPNAVRRRRRSTRKPADHPTSAPTAHRVRRSTPRLRSPMSVRTHHKGRARTDPKSIPVQRTVCAGWSARNPTACSRVTAVGRGDGGCRECTK